MARNDVAGTVRQRDSSARTVSATQPLDAKRQSNLARQCEATAQRLAGELGAPCQTVVRAPFVLGGDLSRDELATWHADTIAPAARIMQRRYFSVAPHKPVTVLLFQNDRSYNDACLRLFEESNISVYGYYKPRLRTIVLNIATGSGTLLHELTHALMDFDFPDAPDWLNEGLASLHEQCRFREFGDTAWIEGLVNWRLAGLQEVLRKGSLRSLASLVEDRGFRGAGEGANYAQARYLCLYLQQRGVLEEFFRVYRDNYAHDRAGRLALERTLHLADWRELDADFQRWVSQLDQ